MNIDEIKNPKDILEYMDDNIQYGWIDIYRNKHINEIKEFNNYINHINENCINV